MKPRKIIAAAVFTATWFRRQVSRGSHACSMRRMVSHLRGATKISRTRRGDRPPSGVHVDRGHTPAGAWVAGIAAGVGRLLE